MEHTYYSDGDLKKISWIIENESGRSDQVRMHIEDYFNKISIEQSKFVALHVGIFWGIGRFIIKNGDSVNVLIDLKSMFDHLSGRIPSSDPFVSNRTRFIQQLISQRNLFVSYKIIDHRDNKASSLLS